MGDSQKSICALCEEEKDLLESHIVPRFCNRPICNEKRQMQAIDLNDGNKTLAYCQDAFKEPLLCKDCEQILNSYEKVFKKEWFDLVLPEVGSKLDSNPFVVSEIDYNSHKLFHLSIIWRFHVARNYSQKMDLGPYAEKIRNKLLTGQAGLDIHFPIVGQLLLKDNSEVVHIIAEPHARKFGNSTRYCMQYAGCDWIMIMTDHPSDDEKTWHRGLSENGTMEVYFGDYKESPIIPYWLEGLKTQTNQNSK